MDSNERNKLTESVDAMMIELAEIDEQTLTSEALKTLGNLGNAFVDADKKVGDMPDIVKRMITANTILTSVSTALAAKYAHMYLTEDEASSALIEGLYVLESLLI